MRKYFTNIQFCPNCFNVNDNCHLEPLEINENIIKCNSCGCYFRNEILINNSKNNFSFPQFSEIKLNKIEESYVNWFLDDDFGGKYIITWPWKSVKFIPILLSQSLLKKPNSKIVVFTNPSYFKNNKFNDSSLPNILNSLYSIKNPKESINTPTIDENNVFFKSNEDNSSLSKNFVDSMRVCFNNKFDLIPCFFDRDYCFINSNKDFNKDLLDNQLFFINESILSPNIIECIKLISPDLIISTDIDALYGNKFIKGNKIYDLFKMDVNLLLFSVDLDQRSSYNIGQKKYFLKNWNIIPHTWDYPIVLNKIKDLSIDEHSFCSSCFSDSQRIMPIFDIDFIECQPLSEIESTFEIFNEIFPYDKKIMDSLKDLMKTPLYIKGKYKDHRVLNRNITFEYIFNLIYNIDLDKWESLRNIFDEIYDFHGVGKNPIAESLVDLIRTKNIPQDKFVVIVHKYDIRGTKLILEDYLGENNILVTSWTDLDDKIKDTSITYAISTIFPQPNYDVFSSKIKKLDIICSPNNHKRFEVYRKNRFTENGLKPIYLLSEEEKAPKLLKECLKDIEVPQEYYEELNKIRELDFIYNNQSLMFKSFTYSKLHKNDNAILISNSYGQNMFLKFNTLIYLLDDGKFVDFEIKNENYNDLINNTIMISDEGYHSIGHIFLNFVIENGQDIVLHELGESKFKWYGFKNLIENMFEWVEILNKIINIEYKQNLGDFNSIKRNLAEYLSNLGLTAKKEKYILDVWLDKPQSLETNEGNINIYEAERPKTEEDIKKIYDGISSKYPQFELTRLGASKCFAASRLLKNIRKNFLKTESSKSGKELDKLNLEFKQFLNKEKKLFNEFKIASVKKVKIKNDAPSFKIIDNPKEYIK